MNTNYILGGLIFLFILAYAWPFTPYKKIRRFKPVKTKEQDNSEDQDDQAQIFINP